MPQASYAPIPAKYRASCAPAWHQGNTVFEPMCHWLYYIPILRGYSDLPHSPETIITLLPNCKQMAATTPPPGFDDIADRRTYRYRISINHWAHRRQRRIRQNVKQLLPVKAQAYCLSRVCGRSRNDRPGIAGVFKTHKINGGGPAFLKTGSEKSCRQRKPQCRHRVL